MFSFLIDSNDAYVFLIKFSDTNFLLKNKFENPKKNIILKTWKFSYNINNI